MLSFYLIGAFVYCILLGFLRAKWLSAASKERYFEKAKLSATLLIPVRNESQNLDSLLSHLEKIEGEFEEVIFIDDQSEDDSFEKLQELIAKRKPFKLIRSAGSGKKAALQSGVHAAKTDLILTSDADCRWKSSWPQQMKVPFSDSSVQLVAGPVLTEKSDGFLAGFQLLDWASILLLTGFSFAQKKPLMCSGANLAFRKSAFQKVGGYAGNEHWLSGDDEFLLKKIHQFFGKASTHYQFRPEALVRTQSEPTWKALFNQRIRWAGKWRAHPSFSHFGASLAVIVMQLFWIASFLLLLEGDWGWIVFFLSWLLKCLGEYYSLERILEHYGEKSKKIHLFGTSLFHPLYSLRIGFGAIFGNYSWKGRSIRGNVNFELNGTDRRGI
ncbi:glycosyltransferase [Algoriphagus formosus]|uniref:Glycosyltransferase n=1 Tax=Algoriphagus formosus TaxID=2007308 RepID=A0A4R5VB86_9BACT|nr:glycosyltransferase [Algoriphagus aquimaris]TDK49528.1 glycosyltransferase [Algoriphagus aquimaris]